MLARAAPSALERAGKGRDQDRIDGDFLGDQRGHQRAGAAKRHHAEARRIDAAAGQHARGLGRHHRGGDTDCPIGDLLGRPVQPLADGRERAARGFQLQRQLAAEPLARRQQPRHQERIGQRRDCRSAAVTRGAGIGADTARADLQRPGAVQPDDRAAAGTDARYRNGRDQHGEFANQFLAAEHRRAGADHADIGAGAADVQRHQIGLCPAGILGRIGGARDARGGTRQQRNDRAIAHGARELGAAVGACDACRHIKAAHAQPIGQPPDIGLDDRADAGVDRGQHGALVFACLRPDVAG